MDSLNLSPESAGTGAAPALHPEKPKRVLLKWSLILSAVLFVFILWQCGSGLYSAANSSDVVVAHFHQLLNQESYDQIWSESDGEFQNPLKKEETLKFFAAVHRKLGAAGKATRGAFNVNATTNGTFVRIEYSTAFEKGTADESFLFKKTVTGDLKLFGYNIQSNAFILN